jgi:hypothetical protein
LLLAASDSFSLTARAAIFFSKSAIAGGAVPEVGTAVEFVEEMGPNGRLRAMSVRPI